MSKRFAMVIILIIRLTAIYPVSASETKEAVQIAVIDTGIAEKHPMLDTTRIAQGKNYVFPEDGTDDLTGHGTRIAGLILGSINGTIPGTAPDAVLVPLVFYSRYPSGVPINGGIEAICRAIYDAVDQYHCQVINISSGVIESDDKLYEAICYAEQQGVIVVSAVGNDNRFSSSRIYYPAAYDTVIGVGAANAELTGAADFSQRSKGVFILAPGENLKVFSIRSGEGYETVSGTSYAAAQVSGFAARIKAMIPDITPAGFRNYLRQSCIDLGENGLDEETGWGLMNMEEAIRKAAYTEFAE